MRRRVSSSGAFCLPERVGRLVKQVERGRKRGASLDARLYGRRKALGRAIWEIELVDNSDKD
jgi:hypothetical protein